MMPAAPYRAPASLPSRALMSGMPMKALLGMTAAPTSTAFWPRVRCMALLNTRQMPMVRM